MHSLIQELKKDLSPDKLKILNLLISQIEVMEDQLILIRAEAHYARQLQAIDDLMEQDRKLEHTLKLQNIA